LATLIDSSYMPRREARYRITAKGVTDVEPKEAKPKSAAQEAKAK